MNCAIVTMIYDPLVTYTYVKKLKLFSGQEKKENQSKYMSKICDKTYLVYIIINDYVSL